jgi:GAF domain-containing protein
MPESAIDVRHLPKADAYAYLERSLRATLDGIADPIAMMATLSCVLHQGFGHLWAGFYRVAVPGHLLRVGPYQGSLGCLEIEFGRGVCGTAAATGKTVVVPDVTKFPGHIACDARARSEIVVPVRDANGDLIAVLDIDSERPAAFDHNDIAGLESLVRVFAGVTNGVPVADNRG